MKWAAGEEKDVRILMTVADVFSASDGRIVIAGADHQMDNFNKEDLEAAIGSFVVVENQGAHASKRLSVVSVDVSESLAGRKNLFLKLDFPFSGGEGFKGARASVE